MSDPKKYYTDPEVIRELYKMTLVTHNILLKEKIPYYASGGTLIGALRHRGIINWDDDVDVEVSYRDIPRIMSQDVKSQFKKRGYRLKFHRESGSSSKYDWVKVETIDKFEGHKLALDIFPMVIRREKQTGRLRTYFWSKLANDIWSKYFLYTDELFPLKRKTFGDGFVFVPRKAGKALDRAYGKDWKRVGYITQDRNHFDLDKPIKLSSTRFKPAQPFYSCKTQRDVEDDDPLISMLATEFSE